MKIEGDRGAHEFDGAMDLLLVPGMPKEPAGLDFQVSSHEVCTRI